MLVVRFSLSFLGVHVTRRQTHNELVSFLPDTSKTGFSSVNRSATPVLRKRKNLQKIALYTTSIQTSYIVQYSFIRSMVLKWYQRGVLFLWQFNHSKQWTQS